MPVPMPTTNPLPLGYAVTLGTVNQLALPYNASRGGITFYNDSAIAVIALCPSSQVTIPSGTVAATSGQTGNFTGVSGLAQGVAAINGPGSITLSPGQAFIIDNMQCTCAWNGIASVAGAALTVLEH